MRCLKCRQPAAVEVRRHNAAYCAPHFLDYFQEQVRRAIKEHKMFAPRDRVLAAVSGGKDSLALWDVLLSLGYRASGLYIHLGIGEYSAQSQEKAEAFAQARGADLGIVNLPEEYGLSMGEIPRGRGRRSPCSACGLAKRYLFNRVAQERGFDVLATGHNLDDEAATLLGNLLHWQMGYLARQSPVLEEGPGLVKKVKPLCRLTEYETAAYAVLKGIDYIVDECPNAQGARSLLYKEALNLLEAASPGAKQSLYLGFLERGRPLFAAEERTALTECARCGQPTTAEVCAFCRLREGHRRHRRAVPAKAGTESGA